MLQSAGGIEQSCLSLSRQLCAQGLRLGVAESCTGGWIAKICTDQAGSSDWFAGGMVVYSNDAKECLLHVNHDTVKRYGAVSSETALEMVAGVLRVLPNADAALAVTGIAGPAGGTPDKPVGLVWIAYAVRGRKATAESFQFSGNRDAVRSQSVSAALNGLVGYLG